MVQFNSLEVYADIGHKAAKAVNERDWSRRNYFHEWLHKALRLETPEYAKLARKAYDDAYKATRSISKVF